MYVFIKQLNTKQIMIKIGFVYFKQIVIKMRYEFFYKISIFKVVFINTYFINIYIYIYLYRLGSSYTTQYFLIGCEF